MSAYSRKLIDCEIYPFHRLYCNFRMPLENFMSELRKSPYCPLRGWRWLVIQFVLPYFISAYIIVHTEFHVHVHFHVDFIIFMYNPTRSTARRVGGLLRSMDRSTTNTASTSSTSTSYTHVVTIARVFPVVLLIHKT